MSPSFSEQELDALLGAYALDAVDDDERLAVEDYLARSPRARAEVAEFREVAALLAGSGAEAPEGLWDRIAGSLEEAPPQMRLAVSPPRTESGSAAPQRRSRRWLIGVTAVAAAIILVLGAFVIRQGLRLDDLEKELGTTRAELASVDLESTAGLAAANPANHQVSLEGDDEPTVVAVLEPDGNGYLLAGDLPVLPENRTYQLWGIVGETPVSLGVLGNDPDVAAFRAAADIGALAISEEDAGGAVVPSTPSLVGNVA